MKSQAAIPVELYSADLINLAIFELDNYTAAVQDAQTRKLPTPTPPSGLSHVFAAMSVKPDNLDDLEKLKSQFKTYLINSPVVNVILSSSPSSAIKQQLTMWFRQQISPNILLNFSVRSDIAGGIVLQVGSKIYDFSFKAALIDNKSRISELANV